MRLRICSLGLAERWGRYGGSKSGRVQVPGLPNKFRADGVWDIGGYDAMVCVNLPLKETVKIAMIALPDLDMDNVLLKINETGSFWVGIGLARNENMIEEWDFLEF